MPKYLSLSLAFCLILLSACDDFSTDQLQADRNWQSYTLANGMKYHFYYKKDEPVEIRLLIHAGSVQETSQQSGYAHFLEHMAFNGSRHFPGNSMVAEFEKAGLEFGPEINASTSYDLTSYKLSLADDNHLDKALTWFRDIGDGLSLEAGQIEDEKGVVLGEIRVSRPREEPLGRQMYNRLIKDTILQQHDVLGSDTSIRELDPQQLQAFYQKWYLPNNAELVIVGDFNSDIAKQLVNNRFSDWKEQPVEPKTSTDIAHINDLSAQLMVLPQGTLSAISLTFPAGNAYSRTLSDQRLGMQNSLINNLIFQRLNNQALAKRIEYSEIDTGNIEIENLRYNYIDVFFAEEKRAATQQFIATELASLRDHGIAQTELDTALTSYRTDLENLDAIWRERTSQQIIEDQEYSLQTGEVYQSLDNYRDNLARFISDTNIKAINKQLTQRLSEQNHINVYAMATEQASQPDRQKWLDENNKQFVSTMSESGHRIAEQKPIEHFPIPAKPGEIISTSSDQDNQLYSWELENGVEVWLKQEPKAENDVYLRYITRNGELNLPEELLPAKELSYTSFMHSGLSDLNAVQLNSFLTRHSTSLYPNISNDQSSLAVTTNKQNLDTAFALLHQAATNAQLDRTQFDTAKNSFIEQRKTYLNSPEGQYSVAIDDAIFGKGNTQRVSSPEQLQAVTADQVEQVYNMLFRQQGDFKLLVVADIEPQDMESYLRRYVANITYTPGSLTTRSLALVHGEQDLTVRAANEPATRLFTVFSSVSPQRSSAELLSFELMSKIVDSRVTSQLREKQGLDYSPFIGFIRSETSDITHFYFNMTVKPQDKTKAYTALNELVAGMNQGVTSEELTTAESQLLSELQRDKHDVDKLLTVLQSYIPAGYDIDAYLNPQPYLDKLTVQDINQAWQIIAGDNAQRLNAYLVPKEADTGLN